MQTPNLPIQVNHAGPAPKTTRAKNPDSDGGQFSAALSREMDQHKNQDQHKSPMIAAAAPNPSQAQPKQAAPAKPQQQQAAKPAEKAPASKAAQAAAGPAKKTDTAGEPATDVSTERARAAELSGPVADMLALVASFNQPGAPIVAAAPAAVAGDPFQAATRPALELLVDSAALQLPLTTKGASEPEIVAPFSVADAPPADPASMLKMSNMPGSATAPVTMGQAIPAKPATALTGIIGATATTEASETGNQAPLARDPLLAGAERPVARAASAGADFRPMAEPVLAPGVRARASAEQLPALAEFNLSAPVSAPLQQAALAVAQAINGPLVGDKIPARVGTPAWDNQVAQKIVWMVGGEEQRASLTLNPPDLGPMQVVLSVTNDMATVTFSSGQAEVRQALEDAMPKLREMMSENGIALGEASVNDGSAEQQQEGAQNNGRQANQGAGPNRGGDAATTGVNGLGANGSAADAQARHDARGVRPGEVRGLVDTFV